MVWSSALADRILLQIDAYSERWLDLYQLFSFFTILTSTVISEHVTVKVTCKTENDQAIFPNQFLHLLSQYSFIFDKRISVKHKVAAIRKRTGRKSAVKF